MADQQGSSSGLSSHHQAFLNDLKLMHELYSIEVLEESLKMIKFHVAGPPATPYASGVFEVDMTFPENYPESLPEVMFVVPIWNSCVDPNNGRVHFEGVTQMTVAEALAYVEEMLRANEADEDSLFFKTSRFWTAKFAGGVADPEDIVFGQKVEALVEMGFSEMESVIALSACDWNLGDAAEQLVDSAPVDEL
uniref:UBC core domain-containing protein n=1 Tax=Caenorhabditis tropicalis TaxID=1561998 RepID=A0A1I7UEY6_9PELO